MSNTYSAEVLADSISPAGVRLITVQVTHPRFILAEVNTHRMLSRNSASSRAIPPEQQIARVMEHPFIPETFNKRVKGMGVGDVLDEETLGFAKHAWLEARDKSVEVANELIEYDVDKSRINRLLEPFMWHTAIISATEWDNFFALRDHPDAQPEFQIIAHMMREVMSDSAPQELGVGEWHLPKITELELEQLCDARRTASEADDGRELEFLARLDNVVDEYKRTSSRRVARVSYDKQNEEEPWLDSVEKCGALISSHHVSPLEHVARPLTEEDPWDEHLGEKIMISAADAVRAARGESISISRMWCGNFRGWLQFRKELPYEHNKALADLIRSGGGE